MVSGIAQRYAWYSEDPFNRSTYVNNIAEEGTDLQGAVNEYLFKQRLVQRQVSVA